MEKLDRLVWAGTSTYHIGPLHIGIRTDSEWLGEVIRHALSTYHVAASAAPANYSVVVPSNGSNDVPTGLNMLYEGHTNLVRTRHPQRVLRALFQNLSKYVPPESGGHLRVSSLALVHNGRAVLVPRAIVTWLDQIAPRLNRAGWQFVDNPWSALNLETSELVVSPPTLTVERGWETEVSSGLSEREPAPVEPGRYPLVGWGVFSSDHQVMTPAAGAAATAGTVLNAGEVGLQNVITWLADSAGRVPVTGLGSPFEEGFPTRLMALGGTHA